MSQILSVIPEPIAQFFADDGTPLVAGLVYVFEAGTTTPAVTYNNADGAVGHENTHPVVLDATGRAKIFLGTGVYKIDVQTALGVSVMGYPVDDIAGTVFTGSVQADQTVSPAINASGLANLFQATINKAGSGSHPVFATVAIAPPTIGAGAGALVEADSLYISGPPTGATANYAMHIASGLAKLDGSAQAPFLLTSASSVLSIVTNVITPTGSVHHLGAGLVKTITVPAAMTAPGVVWLIPDAAFTWDATDNISVLGTAVVNKALAMVWDGTRWNPSYVA